MKVLQVINGWGSGGVERNLINCFDMFNENGIETHIYARKKISNIFDPYLKKYRIKLFVPEERGRFPVSQFLKLKWFQKIVAEGEYDVVHINGSSGDGFIFAYFVKKSHSSSKVVIHCHNPQIPQSHKIRNMIYNILGKKLFSKYGDCFLACSKQARDFLFKNKSQCEIVNYSIDVAKYVFDKRGRASIRKQLNLDNHFVVGTIGRIERQKNPIYILKIIRELIAIDNRIIFLWVGEGAMLEECKKFASTYHLDQNIVFAGTRDDVPSVLSAMDIFILPSLYEGLGIVNIEAQANGLQCFISEQLPEEIDVTNQVHRLSIRVSPKIWAKEILKYRNVLRNGLDHNIISGFDKNENALKVVKVYTDLLGKG